MQWSSHTYFASLQRYERRRPKIQPLAIWSSSSELSLKLWKCGDQKFEASRPRTRKRQEWGTGSRCQESLKSRRKRECWRSYQKSKEKVKRNLRLDGAIRPINLFGFATALDFFIAGKKLRQVPLSPGPNSLYSRKSRYSPNKLCRQGVMLIIDLIF